MKRTQQHLVPCVWFDDQAHEAARFYKRVFPDVVIGPIDHYDKASSEASGKPAGSILTVEFTIGGFEIVALNGGPGFTPNPSISFMVNFDPIRFGGADHKGEAKAKLDEAWNQLIVGGSVLMPLGEYPFCEWYGWVQDSFGVSWELMLTDPEGDPRPFIVPSLMFAGDVCGKAEEASERYMSVFGDSERGLIARYPAGMEPDTEGTVMFTDFRLGNTWCAVMDSAHEHNFGFSEAISLMVMCETQAEIDRYWEALSADPASEQCGWLKDVYGVSWQIVPNRLNELLRDPDPARSGRAMSAMLEMKKLDIGQLERAVEGT